MLSLSIFSSVESITEVLAFLDEDFFDAHGVIARPATEELFNGDAIIFYDFCVAGLIPPFSDSLWRFWRHMGCICSICIPMPW